MSSSTVFVSAAPSSFPGSRSRLVRGLSVLVATCALSVSLLAQDAVDPNAQGGNRRGGRGGQGGQGGQGGAGGGNFGGGGGRGNFNAEEMQAQIQQRIRDQFGITDDAEWNLIYQKITALQELQRTQQARGGGGAAAALLLAGGGRGGRGGGGANFGGGRGGRGGDPDMAALSQAITDKAPDAEIKARMAALRETRKANEERLIKAQEDLRNLLDVRQEAVAVMIGLIP